MEEKNEKVLEFIEEIKKKQKVKAEVKQEKNKLVEAGITDNTSKLKKLENLKKEKILEKHLEISRKKNEHSEFLESANKKVREKNMNFTIQREKASVLKALISKSQSPGDLKKLLDKYQNDKK